MDARRRARRKARYHARKESGLCVRCGDTAVAHKTLCVPCRDEWSAYLKTRYEAMRDALRQVQQKT